MLENFASDSHVKENSIAVNTQNGQLNHKVWDEMVAARDSREAAAPENALLRYGIITLIGIENLPIGTLNAGNDALKHPCNVFETACGAAALGAGLEMFLTKAAPAGKIAALAIGTYLTCDSAKPVAQAYSSADQAKTMGDLCRVGAHLGDVGGAFFFDSALAGAGYKLGATQTERILLRPELNDFANAKQAFWNTVSGKVNDRAKVPKLVVDNGSSDVRDYRFPKSTGKVEGGAPIRLCSDANFDELAAYYKTHGLKMPEINVITLDSKYQAKSAVDSEVSIYANSIGALADCWAPEMVQAQTAALPEWCTPKVQAQTAALPEWCTPKVQAPNSALPEWCTPKVQATNSALPEWCTPKVQAPNSALPEWCTPKVQAPNSALPEWWTPKVQAPNSALPEWCNSREVNAKNG